MTPEQFCFRFQGYLETENPKNIDEMKTQIIKDHLQLVFKKVTPTYPSQPFIVPNFPPNDQWVFPTPTICSTEASTERKFCSKAEEDAFQFVNTGIEDWNKYALNSHILTASATGYKTC